MPAKKTIERARRAKQEGKRPTTQAGAFVKEEMEHAKRGKHAVRSRRQAIAIGLSKARRAGVELPQPERGQAKTRTRQSAQSARQSTRKASQRPAPARRTSTRKRSSR